MWFAQKNKHLRSNQVAFKKGQGTIDALLHFNYVTNAISSKNHISSLALDFEKAFDRVGLHIILRQLSKWNVGPKIYKFIKSFLSYRNLRVSLNNCNSNIYALANGIPQGSPLSVILFVIAFNEVSEILSRYNKTEHILYADDV